MKKLYFAAATAVLFLGSCGETSNSDILSESATNQLEDIEEKVASFGEGGATDGYEYFTGLVSEVVGVDVSFKEIAELDEMDADEADIKKALDHTIEKIESGREAIELYKGENWPLRAEYHTLTLEWFSSVETCVNDHLYGLAEPLSRADDTWSEEEYAQYEKYVEALDVYYDVDQRWVDFQDVYAEKNGFEMGGVIDEDAMVEELIEQDTH